MWPRFRPPVAGGNNLVVLMHFLPNVSPHSSSFDPSASSEGSRKECRPDREIPDFHFARTLPDRTHPGIREGFSAIRHIASGLRHIVKHINDARPVKLPDHRDAPLFTMPYIFREVLAESPPKSFTVSLVPKCRHPVGQDLMQAGFPSPRSPRSTQSLHLNLVWWWDETWEYRRGIVTQCSDRPMQFAAEKHVPLVYCHDCAVRWDGPPEAGSAQ